MEKNQVIEFSGSTPFGSITKIEDKVSEKPVTPEEKPTEEPKGEQGNTGDPKPVDENTPPTQGEPQTKPKDQAEPKEGTENDKPEDSSESDEPKKPNVYRALADILKSDGLLPEELEVPEDADSTFLGSKMREITESSVREQVVQQVVNELQQQGINDHRINMLMMLENGHDPSTVTQMGKLQTYSELQLESLAENDDYIDIVEDVIRSMYEIRGFEQKEIDRMMKALDSDVEKEKVFQEEAVPFHKQAYDNVIEQERQAAQQRVQYERQLKEYNKQVVENIFQTRKVREESLDEKSAQELQKSILTMDQVIQTPDGQQHPVTEFQKFLYDFQSDLEMQIYMFKKFKFKDQDIKKATDEIRKKVESELEQSLQAVQNNPGNPEKQIEEQKKIQQIGGSQPIIVDFSNF